MSKHSFMDTILNRPSQRYTEPVNTKPSRRARQQAPSDLPNAPNRPDSILAGNMFKSAGTGSLQLNGGSYSQAPSVRSGRSNTSRFSLFGSKKKTAPSASGSVYYDGASSIAPTDISTSERKGRWWESGGLTRKNYSRPPSVAGSIFSEPETSGPPGFPHASDSLQSRAPPRGARSDYGGSSSKRRYSSQPSMPPMPSLGQKGSTSSMRLGSGVAPLGQQQPNLMRQASTTSLAKGSNADPSRPISPPASMGRTRSQSRTAANGTSDWNSFVKSMSGTEVAQMWESMPTLAPKPSRTSEKRSSMVASRVRKELEQDAQFQQVQRDPGVVQQDLLARAASQVIGSMPPTPVSPHSELQHAPPLQLQPGQVVAPISPVYSPVASSSSVNVAQIPPSMSLQASAVMMNGTSAPVPVVVPHAMASVPILHAPQPQQHYKQQQQMLSHTVPQQYVQPQQHIQAQQYVDPQQYVQAVPAPVLQQGSGAVPAAMPQQMIPTQEQRQAPVALPASPTAVPAYPGQTSAPVTVVPAPRSIPQPQPAPMQPSTAVAPEPARAAPQPTAAPASATSSTTVPQPTTAQYLANRIEEEESADEESEVSSEESEDSDETSSDEGLVGGGQTTLDVVAEEDEEASSVGHAYHQEMRSHKSVKGKGPSRNYEEIAARLHLRQGSSQSQADDSREEGLPTAPSGVSIQVTEPTDAQTAVVQPALAQAVAAPLLVPGDRPPLVARRSEGSDYASATSGRSTPTAKEQGDAEDAEDEAAVVASIAHAHIDTQAAEGDASYDTTSTAQSQRVSTRTAPSSKPATAPRRLSEVSLGTSFAASGILGGQESSKDSDLGVERSVDDADLRSKSLAEQDRLRKMNVGEDFFGPSFSNMIDQFDRVNYSDSTLNRMRREQAETSATPQADMPATVSNGVVADPAATESNRVEADAQQAINEVRQKRADGENEMQNSTDTTGIAPSFAAAWLNNQAQGSQDSTPARSGLSDLAGNKTSPEPQLSADATKVAASTEPKVSVLDRPRPKTKKVTEMGGVEIAEGKLAADRPQESISPTQSTPASPRSVPSTPTKGTAVFGSKDNASPVKPAAKQNQPRSLADTLFGAFRSPSKDKKEKKEKKSKKDKKDKKDASKHSRTVSVDSVGSASTRSNGSSMKSSPAPPLANVSGKQADGTSNGGPTPIAAAQQPNGVVPSVPPANNAAPLQSVASHQSVAGNAAPDAKDAVIPVYPTDTRYSPTLPNGDIEKSQMAASQVPAAPAPLLAPAPAASSGQNVASADHSAPPTSSEASLASTALTSPEAESMPRALDADRAAPSATETPQKKLVMPPPPALEEVMAPAQEDRTPNGKPTAVAALGINLIPPTPPALESRDSFTSSQVPGTSRIDEYDEDAVPQRPSLMSRSSSQRTAVQSDSKVNGTSEGVTRSKSMAPVKKGIWQEYKGKGLSLPPGLVATTIDSSVLRRMSAQDKKLPSQPVATAAAGTSSVNGNGAAASALAATPVVGQFVPTAPGSVLESPPRPPRSTPSPSPKSKRSSGSLSPLPPTSPAMARIMADAPPVPQIPVGYQAGSTVSGSPSRLYAHSAASSEPDWDSRPVSPAPSAVPSQSGRSVGSHVSSSVHSTSYRNSPRAEYSYVNHHELSPYAKKMRALSPSPALPTLSQTGNRHSLMSAINEWESQMPEREEVVTGLSPYPSRPVSPSHSASPYPALPASTVSRTSSVISSISSPAVVRNAPLGASTNQYLHPPVARSLMSHDGLSAVSESALESLNPPSVVGGRSGASSAESSSPSASQSALSLSSTIPTSMPTVPTSYRPNKDPKRFTTNADDLLNNRTTMQTVAVTSGAFASRSKSIKRKKSSDTTSSDIPAHLQDELSLTTLSLTAHTPPPRKIGSHQVLVQVIAVAIDETDKLLLREKVRADNAFGYVPGRSFCGRIVECGYEVKKMRKGDIVFGLQDSRKSGALAEFMVIDHNRICHAPSDCLTTEQIAALPSAGVMAHQLIQNHCSQLQRGARVLILNAHDGVGLLTLQESVGLGLVIVAQCPPSVSDGVAVCQANGAHEVVIGEPLWAINSLHESSFDLIVDTVGGRKIYDASRRILASEGQFCTCYGDEHGTNNPNLKSHFRSLRRAFFKKDKKNLGYEWVGVDTGEDCKEALEAVKRAAERGDVCPRLRSVLPFADAGRAFDAGVRVDEEPGAIVVRVS
ncbi:Alcohol dehydrogenase GroES-like protein [Kalmanozyma brasiliensis GHG001]|uniref:Alcohol dehydrogenase GroES-like protein n=1 Tax=Kalmanozyma brasiliensis (strain GHG001) TaxID=1365824 RepID=UPI002867D9D3|nr:Alcohol dehydrogenase GroES-like protein [Kalmanozyma brasiliensis GHG001]EST06152.2 Alcohol dehydrogenase GroES-like protein [Kalmanozyma brasiliensis GHG001]